MSYYFCIVGTRDNPLYQADLASKPAGSSGPSSFFSSSSSSNATSSAAASTATTASAGAGHAGSGNVAASVGGAGGDATKEGGGAGAGAASGGGASTTSGGVFGFGNALGAIAGGFGATGSSFGSIRDKVPGAGAGSSSSSSVAISAAAAAAAANGEGKGLGFGRYNDKHVLQMIAHSSLDVVEDKQFVNSLMYLKAVDRINEWTTSAFIAPGNIKFLILHEHKHDDGIRNFFYDVWELLVKTMMNPFHDLNEPIRSASFDTKVRASARKHL